MIAAPMFHSWGFAHFTLGLGLGSTLVLRRKFDPEDTLSATAQHECTALVVVPVMLQRILELPAETIDRYDLSALRVIAASGSALPGRARAQGHGPLRRRPLQPLRLDRGRVGDDRDARGPARRAGHRRAPAARDRRQALRRGGRARSRRARPGASSSATRWPSRATPAAATRRSSSGLMSSGDVGHFDDGGRLFVDGRDDEMIVSGGENVFPREVEDLLADHDGRRRGRGHRRRRRGVRPAAEGVRRVRAGAKADADELKDHVKANLARYKVPREIVFLDELPRNATGKVLKRELAERGEPVALLAAVALVAAVVQASTGLGFALVLSPAVFALLEPESAVVAITVLGLALNGLVLFGERRRPLVAWRRSARSSSPRCPGAVRGPRAARAAEVGAADRGRRGGHRRRGAAGQGAPRSDGADARRPARAAGARLRHRHAEHLGGRQRPADRAVVRPPRPAARRDPRLAQRRLPRPRDHRRGRAGAGARRGRRRGRLGRARRGARVRRRRPRDRAGAPSRGSTPSATSRCCWRSSWRRAPRASSPA